MAFVAGTWFRWLLGIGADEIPAGAEAHWSWTHLPQSWRVFVALFAAIALLYGVWWLYRWETPTLSPVRRRWLAGLRMAVVAILAVTALGPAISYTQQRVLRPVVVVLRDASQSMATADVPTDSSVRLARADQVNRWLTDAKTEWLVALRERVQLRVFDFA
ncbi:MAG: hypothetical protein SH850_31240, partial [Planctomycetaceae bacterium]|nr:hypothetical protein [Planctomycetaceae bacterium]